MLVQCRGCDKIYEVCNLPMDVFEVVRRVKAAKCPRCDQSGKLASIYMGEENGREEGREDCVDVEQGAISERSSQNT